MKKYSEMDLPTDSGNDLNPPPMEQEQGNPKQAIQTILKQIENEGIEAHFVDIQSGESNLSPEDIEIALSNYAQDNQDEAEYSKWKKIDSTIREALDTYRMNLRVLLSSIIGKDQARSMIQNQSPMPGQQQPQQTKPDLNLPTADQGVM